MICIRATALLLSIFVVGAVGCASSSAVTAGDPGRGQQDRYDIVIYGGTSAGVIAAVQAKRDGLSVALVCPETRLGGLTSGGLGWTDSGNKAVIGGLSRGFYEDIYAHYADDAAWTHRSQAHFTQQPRAARTINHNSQTMWVFEPRVAAAIFERYIVEHGIPVFRDHWLDREDGVAMDGQRIMSITTLNGAAFYARVFIDATYEGDLLAAARVSYAVGRESSATYGETLNGNQPLPRSHQFTSDISAYVVPGDPTSGLLPRAEVGGEGQAEGERGAGDHRVQAYCFRMCLTDVPENRVPFPRPEGYDAGQYELLLRTLLAGSRHVFGKFDPAPNGKTDTNNHGSFSTDNLGMNYDYPEASYERRAQIIAEHRDYQQGYLYFLCNDPRVPAEVRRRMSAWGLCKDEFVETGHWPGQLYIREARRMVSDFVTTEGHVRRHRVTPSPVGMGSYNMDSHNVRRYVDADGFVRNEGDVQVGLRGPYPIGYGAIVPRRGECENLLVPVCVSASHIAFGSIRMEPVFMILGQSAAQAAKIAIEEGVAVQDVDYELLEAAMLEAGQVLGLPVRGIDPASLAGVVVDDEDAWFEGEWTHSHATDGFVHEGYRHDGDARDGEALAVFLAEDLPPGRYEVRLAYTANANRSSRTQVNVSRAGGVTEVLVDQRAAPPIDGAFVSLGVYRIMADTKAAVIVSNGGADGHVIADAVQWILVED